jgi:antitoxin component of RelBE/YafQ-DinJ toxin-antitoxin module
VRIRRVYDHPMQVRLDEELYRELQHFADEQGIRTSTLARMWLQQRIQQERERRAS